MSFIKYGDGKITNVVKESDKFNGRNVKESTEETLEMLKKSKDSENKDAEKNAN